MNESFFLFRNYFVVNIKDTPPEFYNAKSLTFMRSLESKPSSFVAVVSHMT